MSCVCRNADRIVYLVEDAHPASEFPADVVLANCSGMGAERVPPSVAIGICTAFRPNMLKACLEAIAAQQAPADVTIHVVVADNEPERSNEALVREFGLRSGLPVHYIHEPRRGIPQARNAVLAKCRSLGVDWIAFTDDDCRVDRDWVGNLLQAATRHGADVIYGRRELVVSDPPPLWSSGSATGGEHSEGDTLRYAATHNVLLRASLVRGGGAEGLQFDERLAHGEDTDFFHRAADRGARIVYSRDPVVFETVCPERTTLAYQIRRAYHYAASRSYFHRRYKGWARATKKLVARWVFQVPLAVVRLLVAPTAWLFSKPTYRTLVLKGMAGLAGALGASAGLFGRDGNPYRTIDGY
jgi:succinoglycan biosynthesis protein ExoM